MQIREPEFDHLFDSILTEEGGGAPAAGGPAAQPGIAGRRGIDALEEKIRAALALFYKGDYARCLAVLGELQARGANDPRISAFQGACQALLRGQLKPGLEACVQALRQAFYIPDLYCALGMILLRAGDRSKAYAAFQRGLKIDPNHPALSRRVAEMGIRRPPALSFLRRTHPANRVLGMLRARLFPA